LQTTVASFEQVFAMVFIHEFDPAFEYKEHLKIEVVGMWAGVWKLFNWFFYTDDVGVELTMGRITYSEVAVFEKRPKTSRPGRVPGMTGTEFLWLLGHGRPPYVWVNLWLDALVHRSASKAYFRVVGAGSYNHDLSIGTALKKRSMDRILKNDRMWKQTYECRKKT